MKKYFLSFLVMISCANEQRTFEQPGTIGVLSNDKTFTIYESGSLVSEFNLAQNSKIKFSNLSFYHGEKNLVAVQNDIESGNQVRGNLVKINYKGEILERIYEESKKGKFCSEPFLSHDDKRILFSTYKNLNRELFEQTELPYYFTVLEIDSKKLIRIDKKIIPEHSTIDENPWLRSSDAFVYSLASWRYVDKVVGSKISRQENPPGVYLYNLADSSSNLILQNGSHAVVSPVKDQIAYANKNSLRIFDLTTQQDKLVYRFAGRETPTMLHWTPDGKAIFLETHESLPGMMGKLFFDNNRRMIDVASGKEFPCGGVSCFYYAWR